MVELIRDRLWRVDEETRVLALQNGSGTQAATYRTRVVEGDRDDGGTEMVAEYGAGCWTDADACRALFDAVAADAATLGVDRTQVVVPETARHVSDAALAHAELSDHSDFDSAGDLTTR